MALDLHLCGEEDALSFAVRGGYGLKLKEVEQNLDLRENERESNELGCSNRTRSHNL